MFPVGAATAALSLAIIEKTLIGVAVIAALFGGRAFAADLKATAPPPPRFPNWSGPYIGVGVAARYNAVDANITSASVGTPPTAIPLPTVSAGYTNPLLWWGSGPGAMQFIDNISIGLRVYGGWNYQVAPDWVVGVEGDYAYANESAVFHGSPFPANLLFGSPTNLPFGATPNDEFKVRTTWDGSVRLRGGWLATPSTLFYLTAGLAWAQLGVTSTCSTVATANVSNCAPGNYFSGTLGPASITHSGTKLGWTAGTGAEVLFWSNWVARAQYRFSDFGYVSGSGVSFTGTRTCSGCAAANSPLTVSYALPFMQHNFEIGIAYKFGQ